LGDSVGSGNGDKRERRPYFGHKARTLQPQGETQGGEKVGISKEGKKPKQWGRCTKNEEKIVAVRDISLSGVLNHRETKEKKRQKNRGGGSVGSTRGVNSHGNGNWKKNTKMGPGRQIKRGRSQSAVRFERNSAQIPKINILSD